MEPTDFTSIIAHLKGAPISILMILLSMQHPVNERTLSLLSGYCLRSVKEGLQNLLLLGLVDYIEEIGGWRPSQRALALLQKLSGEENAADEGKNSIIELGHDEKNFFTSIGSRSSLLTSEMNRDKKHHLQPPPKPPPKRRKQLEKQVPNLPDDPQIQQAYLLLVRTGIPNYKAEDAIQTSVNAGWDGEKIINAVNGWLDYAASDQGETIKQPGFLVASRLKSLQEPPENTSSAAADVSESDRYTSGKFGHLIKS